VEYFGKEASAFTKHMVWKKRVLLRDDPMNRTRDRYDRLLRYVLLEDGTLVNAEIIRQGYGFAHTPSRLRRSSASCSGRRGKRALDRRIQTVIAILEKQWNKRVDVRLTARMVRLSPSHLEHLFKQQVRICIRDFIQEKRLHAAAVQLAITYERVSTICFLVGFTDVSNFNHAFKRKFGLSPRQYRDRASLSARRSNQEIATATKK
jgi:AraC-like DNA-binding protein